MKRLLLTALLAASLASPVTARAVTTTITVNELDPHLGGVVTFTIVIDKNKDCTGKAQCGFVSLACDQNGVEVYSDYPKTVAEARSPGFLLGYGTDSLGHPIYTTEWVLDTGPATCTATVFNYHFNTVYATTTFEAAG